MRVIGAGFGRTGTLSLKAALEQLGFGPCYHMFDVLDEPERAPAWEAAAEGEAVDWDAVLDGFEATVDWPGARFYAELAERYPDAPVLLTVRDPDAWYESTYKTIHAAREAAQAGEGEVAESPELLSMINAVVWEGTFGGRFGDREHAIEVFNRHNAAVEAAIPAERLLVHEIKQGWEPIAGFLGVEAPDAPFPRLNDTESFRQAIGMPALSAR